MSENSAYPVERQMAYIKNIRLIRLEGRLLRARMSVRLGWYQLGGNALARRQLLVNSSNGLPKVNQNIHQGRALQALQFMLEYY